jgi:hypothetical protein
MMRFLTALACLLVIAVSPAGAQVGFDRPGGDYTSFAVRTGDPLICATRCERDGRCRAWSFVYPTGERGAVCSLKAQVPARVENGCCVSGVKGAGVIEPRTRALEFSIDRVGGDLRSLDITPDATGSSCRAACEAESRCRAWTYVRPGYIGAAARCFLKDRIMPPRRKPCCISGVVR